jgi:hypothetical protein
MENDHSAALSLMVTPGPGEACMKRLRATVSGKADQKTLARWAADCAAHVLPHFERAHPKDDRPRQAVEAARAWARGEIKVQPARRAALAAHAAARAATLPAASAAARAAGHAAATAHVATHSRAAATYAIKAVTLAAAAKASARERAWQLRRLPPRLRPVAFPVPPNDRARHA